MVTTEPAPAQAVKQDMLKGGKGNTIKEATIGNVGGDDVMVTSTREQEAPFHLRERIEHSGLSSFFGGATNLP